MKDEGRKKRETARGRIVNEIVETIKHFQKVKLREREREGRRGRKILSRFLCPGL